MRKRKGPAEAPEGRRVLVFPALEISITGVVLEREAKRSVETCGNDLYLDLEKRLGEILKEALKGNGTGCLEWEEIEVTIR